jgi:hypothetical protein
LSALINKLLEKTPDDRIQSAVELSGEVARLKSSLESAGPSTVLDVDGGGLPKSARTSPSTDDSAATLDVAEGKKTEAAGTSRRRRAVVAGAALAAVFGAALFWGTRGNDSPALPTTLSSATAALLSSLPPLPAAVPSASAEPTEPVPSAASRTEGPGTLPTSSASTRTTFSETKSTKTVGNTTTTKHTTRKATVTEKRTVEKKRRTGPGGIYIPPPSEWFK